LLATDHWPLATDNWPLITTLDAHAGGEPLRIILDGLPPIPGETILAKRRYAQTHLDDLRKALMWEPRGHADMYGCILTEPVTADGTLGVLFMHNEGFSTMCGHGVIALVTAGLQTGFIRPEGDPPIVRLDTPAGRVTATADWDGRRVRSVSFDNVPSFAFLLDGEVEVDGIGRVRYDIGFGGAFYAYVRAEDLGVDIVPEQYTRLIDLGRRIKQAVTAATPPRHPFEPDLNFIYGTIIVGPAHDPANHSREVCIFADGEVDRSPTGTGVSGRVALHHARGEIGLREPFVVESIVGSRFAGEAVEAVTFGPHAAVVPRITGSAYLVGRSEWWVDPEDPLRNGFILR
jgi:trans-L-3-hydroxyproline dehydratase